MYLTVDNNQLSLDTTYNIFKHTYIDSFNRLKDSLKTYLRETEPIINTARYNMKY
jgi:hypothetical protein